MEEVFSFLKTSPKGLSDEEAADRLIKFGPNKLEEKKVISLFNSYIKQISTF